MKNIKNILSFVLAASIFIFPQNRFSLEGGVGADLTSSFLSPSNFENGYSLYVSSVYHLFKTISISGTFAFHKAEGITNGGVYAVPQDYSKDNPSKPNNFAYEAGFGMRADFSDQGVTPYFVIRAGLLFLNFSFYETAYLDSPPGMVNTSWHKEQRIEFYISPGFGLSFKIQSNLSFLIEARFNMTTGNYNTFIPLTTGIQIGI